MADMTHTCRERFFFVVAGGNAGAGENVAYIIAGRMGMFAYGAAGMNGRGNNLPMFVHKHFCSHLAGSVIHTGNSNGVYFVEVNSHKSFFLVVLCHLMNSCVEVA